MPTSIDCVQTSGQAKPACDRVTGYHSCASIVYNIPRNAADMSFDLVIEDLWQRHLRGLDPAVAATRFRRDWSYRAWFASLDMMDILDGKVGGEVCVADCPDAELYSAVDLVN